MIRCLALAAVLAVAGCVVPPSDAPPERNYILALSQACNVYAAALTDLAALRAQGRLSVGEIAAVDSVRAVASPLCIGEPRDARAAMLAVEQAMLRMPKVR